MPSRSPLFTTLLSNWKLISNKLPLCASLSENKRTKIDLKSLKWACGAGVYRWDHFIHFWWQFTNMQNWEPLHHNLRAKCSSSTCLITSSEHNFPAHRGGGGEGGELWQCQTMCVNNSTLYTAGMSCRKSSQLVDLLMHCDSCCQQFSPTRSSCNFQPSPQCWYRFKRPLTITHTEAAGAINCLLWF